MQWVAHLRQLERHYILVGNVQQNDAMPWAMWNGEDIEVQHDQDASDKTPGSLVFSLTIVAEHSARILTQIAFRDSLQSITVHSINSILRPCFLCIVDGTDFGYLKNEKNLTEYINLCEQAGAVEIVADAHTYTSFALSNEAIEKLPEHVKSIIRNPPPDISPLMINFDFVTIHGLGSKVLPRELMKNETLTAYNLEKLSVQVSEMDRSATITNIK